MPQLVLNISQNILGLFFSTFFIGFILTYILSYKNVELDSIEKIGLSFLLSAIVIIIFGTFLTFINISINYMNIYILLITYSSLLIIFYMFSSKLFKRDYNHIKLSSTINNVFKITPGFYINIPFVFGLFMIFYGSIFRNSLPYFYFYGFILMSLSIILFIVNNEKRYFIHLIIFGITIRAFPLVGTEKVILQDPTYVYLSSLVFLYKGNFLPIINSLYNINYYSVFPGTQIYSIIIFLVSNISLLNLTFTILPLIIFAAQIIFVYKISNYFIDDQLANSLSIIIYSIWPIGVFSTGIHGLIPQHLAVLFILSIVYYYLKSLQNNNIIYILLILMSYLALVITHILSSIYIIFVFSILIISLCGLKIFNYLFKKNYIYSNETRLIKLLQYYKSYLIFPIIIFQFLGYYFTKTAFDLIFGSFFKNITNIISSMLNGNSIIITSIGLENSLYSNVSIYIKIIPTVMTITICILSLTGFIYSIKHMIEKILIVVILTVSIVLLIIIAIIGIIPFPYRYVLFLALPVSIFCGLTVKISKIMNKKIIYILIPFLILSSSYSLVSFFNPPLQIYNISNDPINAQLTSTMMINLNEISGGINWLKTHTNFNNAYYLGTDFSLHMSLFLFQNASSYKSVISLYPDDFKYWSNKYDVYLIDRTYIPQVNEINKLNGTIVYIDNNLTIYKFKYDYFFRHFDKFAIILKQGDIDGGYSAWLDEIQNHLNLIG